MESIFAFLFKYRPFVFEKGHFALSAPWSMIGIVAFGVVVLGALSFSYTRVRGKSRWQDRVILGSIRAAALAVILFCLFRPKLMLSTVVPQRNFLGILIDDSQSMQIADQDGARSAFVARTLGSPDSALFKALAERFQLRFFRFSSTADRVADATQVRYTGRESRLGHSLEAARTELAGLPVSGLVVVSDGADNSGVGLTESLLALKGAGVPVFTVGLGRERFEKDIEISRVDAPRSVLLGTSLVVDLLVRQNGYRGSKITVFVEDAGRIVGSREVELPPDGQAAPVRVHFTVTEAGPRVFRFRIAPQAGELVTPNNQQDALILVNDRRDRVLYFEGEPRWEVKFIRRAVDADKNLQVVVLQRTAQDKFLRLSVDSANELIGGFPKTREELFRYRGLILGSVEAGFFTPDQLRMIADFVSQRGGGLLALGGRRSFSEGGYTGTSVADVLPVALGPRAGSDSMPFFAEMKVEPTPAGLSSPITQIGPTEEASAQRWKTLPELSTFNPIGTVKPGATTLLTGSGRDLRSRQAVLAYQRYGRGKSAAFTVQDSWLWQMHASIPLEDQTHETLWRQLLRWIVSDVPFEVTVTASRDRVSPGDPVTLTAEVDDDRYFRINNAVVTAQVVAPTGEKQTIPLDWTVSRDGEYRGTFTPKAEGLYAITVSGNQGSRALPPATAYVQATPLSTEYFDAEMHAPLLKRIAEETGGRFYTPATVSTLPEDVSYTQSGAAVVEEKDLWDMPILFLLLVGLVSAEWGYRRKRGLA
ncbi:MAG: hypothetical protein HY700_01260 [Gemmatimonadetes bacterium]|nr:hypothetical protein [Gemmatimonadota bacterium]